MTTPPTCRPSVSGQVDAIGGNTTYKLNLDKAAPGNDYEQKLVFNEQWMGVCTKLGDKEMNAWLNQFIDKIRADGRPEAINKTWLGEDSLPDFPRSSMAFLTRSNNRRATSPSKS